MKKKGISLIVLVITIIVMIILAASVVITLSNTGVINRASEAVDLTNEAQVQDLAALIWADAYMDNKRDDALVREVTTKLGEQRITTEKWNIEVSNTGVTVTSKNTATVPGLGSLISKDNYGDTVDYSVTVNGITYDDWQIYYHNADYVYLIASESVGSEMLDKEIIATSLTSDELELYEKFRVGNADKYPITDSHSNSMVAQLIKDYANFANTTTYGTNVVGAIGGPTLELLSAGWNAKGYTPTMTLTTNTYGYKINNDYYVSVTSDGLYVSSNCWYWLASPNASDDYWAMNAGCDYSCVAGEGYVGCNGYDTCDVRPVVCLKASIPATVGTGDYDFSLTK